MFLHPSFEYLFSRIYIILKIDTLAAHDYGYVSKVNKYHFLIFFFRLNASRLFNKDFFLRFCCVLFSIGCKGIMFEELFILNLKT